jgi:cholestenol Delta-isomerase
MASTDLPLQPHPYYPADLILPGYVPNDLDATRLMVGFAAMCAVVFSIAYLVNDDLKFSDRLTVVWFVICECILFSHSAGFAMLHQADA